MDQFYSNFVRVCASRGIECQIAATRWLELKKEYGQKCDWKKELQDCILWLYDNNLKKMNANRLRNWLKKAKPINPPVKPVKLKPSPLDVYPEEPIAGQNLKGFKPKSVDEVMAELANMADKKQMSQPSYVDSLRARAEDGDGRAKYILGQF